MESPGTASLKALSVQGLTVRFGGLNALEGVSFDVLSATVVSVVGPNGAGKTTVLNCISGFVPARGSVLFQGKDLLPLAAHRRAALGIARTFQGVDLFQDMTLLDNVVAGSHPRMRSNLLLDVLWFPVRSSERLVRERAHEQLEVLGIQKYALRPARSLPFGVQKLAGIARALACRPELLLLDEPAAGLNRQEVAALANRIAGLRNENGITVLLVEHNMRLVMDVSDQIVVLDQGSVISKGDPKSVSLDPLVVAAYLGSSEDFLQRRIGHESSESQ